MFICIINKYGHGILGCLCCMDTHIINVDFYAKNTHHRLNDECKYSFAYSLGKPSAQYCLHELSYNRNLYWNLKVYIIIQVMVHQQFFMKCLFTSEDGLQILKLDVPYKSLASVLSGE